MEVSGVKDHKRHISSEKIPYKIYPEINSTLYTLKSLDGQLSPELGQVRQLFFCLFVVQVGPVEHVVGRGKL